MPRIVLSRVVGVVLIAVLSCVIIYAQQTGKAPAPAPIPVQIVAAKRVFISNGGADALSQGAFDRGGDPQQPYNHFYAAMKEWGRYELVTAPAEADLVFEIRFGAPISNAEFNAYAPHLAVTIVDAKTHFTLWTVTEFVEGAFRKKNWDKNFRQGMTRLMDDLKKLVTQTASTTASTQP